MKKIRIIVGKVIKRLNKREKIMVPIMTDSGHLLETHTALITGGCGGIGSSIAKRFSDAGCNVIVSGTSLDKVKTMCEQNPKLKGILLDLQDVASFEEKITEAEKLFGGGIDILVNCAGFNPETNFFDASEDDFDNTMAVNIKGTFFLSRVVSNRMIANCTKGHILNISSSSALRPAWSPYEISKWALKGFTIGMADSLIPHGIVVNGIAPGPTATKMQNRSDESDLDYGNPIGRLQTPDEIANLALVLASDMGNIVVGDTLYATGGSGVISLHN